MAFKCFQFSCGIATFSNNRYDGLFTHILQIAHAENAIWHAAVALGSLHQHEAVPSLQKSDAFSLVHYSRALKLLNIKIASGDSVSPITILAACLLLATFEVLHRHFEQASLHYFGGLNYLCDIAERRVPGLTALQAHETFPGFLDAFQRLEISSSVFDWRRSKFNYDALVTLPITLYPDLVIRDMRKATETALHCLLSLRQLESASIATEYFSSSFEVERLRDAILTAIGYWDAAMCYLDLQLTTSEQVKRAQVLQIYVTHCKICALTIHPQLENEMRFDLCMPEFDKIARLAADFFGTGQVEAHEEGFLRYPSFSVHIGVLHILWFVAIKCRDPRVRRHAIRLLRGCNHGDNDAWDGQKIARYAERVVVIEEDAHVSTATDVVEGKRIVQAWFNHKRDDGILHCRKRVHGSSDKWLEWQEVLNEDDGKACMTAKFERRQDVTDGKV